MAVLRVCKWIMYGVIGFVVAVMTFVIGTTISILLTVVYTIAVSLGLSALAGLVIQDLLEKPDETQTKKPP